jgi:hypothetical protein
VARAKKSTSETPASEEAAAAAGNAAPGAEVEAGAEAAAEPSGEAKTGRRRRAKDEPAAAAETGEMHVETAEHALGALADEAAETEAAPFAGDFGSAEEPVPEGVASTEAPAEAADESSWAEGAEPEAQPEGAAGPLAGPPVPPAGHPPPPAGSTSGGGFVAGLLGGALAIAAGVGALWLSNPDLLRGQAPQPDFSPLEARLDAQATDTGNLSDEVTRLSATVEALPKTPPDTAALEARVAALEGELAAKGDEIEKLSTSLDVLEGRVGQVEVRPPVMEGDAAAASEQVVAEMRAALDAQRAEIEALVEETRGKIESAQAEAEAMQATAEAAAKATVARASYARLQAALEAGGPFSTALSELSGAIDAPIPPALSAAAEKGVPTLADLSRTFPEAARAALAASIRAGVPADAGPMERLGAFLRSQTGARSTTAREGDDPDAVLSRAEAALAEGQLGTAVSLLDALPEEGQAEMAAWRQLAEARLSAVEAADTLAAALPAN